MLRSITIKHKKIHTSYLCLSREKRKNIFPGKAHFSGNRQVSTTIATKIEEFSNRIIRK